MNPSVILDNLITPPVLFFLLGVLATLLRSDLDIPTQVTRALSLYLLLAIGLHGGHELSRSTLNGQVLLVLLAAMATSLLVPLWSFAILRLRLSVPDAAAIAATYGSVSAVTFITAVGFLNAAQIPFGGHMVAAMALMESPAIITGVLLARWFDPRPAAERLPWTELGREAFINGAVLLLLGSLVIGFVTGDDGWNAVKPLVHEPFKGVLCLFLLDMGLVAAKRLRDLRAAGPLLIGFAIVAAAGHAMLGVAIARLLDVSAGDALLLAVLTGSASYIAVPAAVRLAIPSANPSLYIPMSLGITFPFNVIVGIPLYHTIVQALWRTP
jgi:hypothetical protein